MAFRIILLTIFEIFLSCNAAANIIELEFIETIRKQQNFETILFIRKSTKCVDYIDEIVFHIGSPKILVTEKTEFYLKSKFNKRILAVVCLDHTDSTDPLIYLSRNLKYMRLTRTVILVNQEQMPATALLVKNVFKYCERLRMLNAVIVFKDFSESYGYYRYNKFPEFHIEYRIFNNSRINEVIYPDRLRNIQGYPIHTLPDGVQPRSIVYEDKKGKLRVSGYIWYIVSAFIETINGSVRMPYDIKPIPISQLHIRELTNNGTLDIPVRVLSSQMITDLNEYSYPVTMLDWCVMVPQEQEISPDDIVLLLSYTTFSKLLVLLHLVYAFLILCSLYLSKRRLPTIIDFFANDSSIRGLLGQPFPCANQLSLSLRITLTLLLLTGLFNSNTYVAHFQTFLTHPPITKPIVTIEDLHKSSLKILIMSKEYSIIPVHIRHRYKTAFNITDDKVQFLKLRDDLNPCCAYMVPSDYWRIFEQQQRHFANKIFRLTNICFLKTTTLNIMLQENSIYRDKLNLFINQMFANGILKKWIKSSFDDMLKAGKVSFEDWSETWVYTCAEISDYIKIFIFYGIANTICVLCFCVEVLWYRFRKHR